MCCKTSTTISIVVVVVVALLLLLLSQNNKAAVGEWAVEGIHDGKVGKGAVGEQVREEGEEGPAQRRKKGQKGYEASDGRSYAKWDQHG